MNIQAWFRDAPIKRKLLAMGLLTAAFALLVISLLVTVRDVIEWRARAVSDLASSALMIGSNAAPALLFDDHKAVIDTLSALSAKPNIVHAVVYDRQGKVFAVYRVPLHIHDVLPGTMPGRFRFDVERLVVSSPIYFKNEQLGSISLESDLHDLYAGVLRGMGLMLIAGFSVFLLAALLFSRLQKRFTAPILDMDKVMKIVISEQDFSARVTPQGRDEIGTLARMLNSMLEHIQMRDAQLADYRQHLEEKIALRTDELRAANTLLEGELVERRLAEEAVRRSETKFRTLYDSTGDAVMLLNLEGFVGCNQATLTLFGCATEKMFCAYHPADLSPKVQSCGTNSMILASSQIATAFKHGSHRFEWIHKRIDTGAEFPAEVLLSAMMIDGKQLLQAVVHDITERKLREADIRIAATAFDSQEGMMVTDADNLILKVNRAFTDITGYTSEEIVGKNPKLLSSGRHSADFYAAMWRHIISTGEWDGEIYNKRKNGEIYPERLTITAVKDQQGVVTNFVGTMTDITARKLAEEEIRTLAFYDTLTHLPNRRLLMDRLKQAMASSAHSGRQAALLFLDLDHFKDLNDTLGHDVGDLLLKQVALRLESCVRAGDTVARLGGDEFVVVLEALSAREPEAAAQAKAVGDKIMASLNRIYQLDTYMYHNSPSIGAVLFSGLIQSQEELLKQADIALYQAKSMGRNRLCFFDPQMQDAVNSRTELEGELRKALEAGQFHLHYQIQVDEHARPLGAETLIRWIHPERGLISPAQFIPMAEETGLIVPIGLWVLKAACAQLNIWQNDPLTRTLVMAVNVSAKQFLQPDFVAQLRRILVECSVQPDLLKLELTESMLLDNIENTITTMHELKALGIQFSLDDFGTGYSSLQYLKRLPLNQLKIDQSFVRDIAVDSNDQAIVRTIIAMAHSLNLDVIAEGVENAEQRQLLLQNGCTHFQGYLFGRPVPIDQFDVMLKQSGFAG